MSIFYTEKLLICLSITENALQAAQPHREMRYIELQVVDETKCQDELSHETYAVDVTMMCAYAEGKGACHGDELFKMCTNLELKV